LVATGPPNGKNGLLGPPKADKKTQSFFKLIFDAVLGPFLLPFWLHLETKFGPKLIQTVALTLIIFKNVIFQKAPENAMKFNDF